MSPSHPVLSISTARLLLSCWAPGDAALLDTALSESREQLLPWLPWAAQEPEGIEAKLARILEWREALLEGRDSHYAVFERERGTLLGALGIHPRVGPGGLELGYWLHPAARGRGYATEAASAATRVAFELLGAHRVELHVDSRNTASVRLAERLGFRLESRLREWGPLIDEERGDRLIYALLARERASSPVAAVGVRALGLQGEVLLDDLG